jgi:hypothetical protein
MEKRSVTTPVGRRIFRRMKEIDLVDTIEQLQNLYRRRDEKRELLINRLYRDLTILDEEGDAESDDEESHEDIPEDQLTGIEPPDMQQLIQDRLDRDLIGKESFDDQLPGSG